ncbi:DUF5134 domain-containing protein [Streptomyces sp. SB3404]|uniref:DUF5134 domain-containing protein n=1 Tax=Streptomyces boncukensis TaxID=2711219 RepID=A0A6G4X8X4_9ACTN|nr:DUF5134 domain-containing protein [Streptomyces boncukensis]
MIAAMGLRWILTLVFAALAGYAAWRAVRSPRWPARVSHALHAAMAVAMAVMVWPWGMQLAVGPQTALFTAAALWFPVAASACGDRAGRAREALRSLPHAAAMAAMAWMVYAMDAAMSGGAHGSGGSGSGGAGGGEHAGHHGGSESGLATMSLTGPDARTAAGVLAAFFLACALWWLARGFDEARTAGPAPGAATARRAYDLLCHGVMAAGMAVMYVLMI